MKRPCPPGVMARDGTRPYRGFLGAVLAITLLVGSLRAQQTSARPDGELPLKVVRQIEALLAAKAQRTAAQRKVSSQFLDARRTARGQLSKSSVAALQAPAEVAADERVTVDIRADVMPAVLARIRALGGTVVNSVPKYRAIRARLPLAALEPLATLEAVQFIRPADQPITHQVLERSAVARVVVATSKFDTTEGDVAHQANSARTTHSVDGTGIGIGVISDGVETLADQQATGDVAARVTVLPGQEGGSFPLSCGGRSKGSEGTAMLEIVHDLAPGAELFFATGAGGAAQMAQNIEDLCAASAEIIVDDLGYLGASAFQDDVIAQAISAAAANGCYHFSSAGNGGNLNDGTAGVWEGDFANGGTLTLNGVLVGFAHDFGGGVTGNRIKKDSTLPIVLKWADPVDGSSNDYDLFLIDAANNVLPVTATGGTADRALTAEQTITVTVRNVEEAGTVSFSQVEAAIRAKLSDPDGGVNGASWQWARSLDRSTGWVNISSATSAVYTPSSDDEEKYLRARCPMTTGMVPASRRRASAPMRSPLPNSWFPPSSPA